MRFKIAHDARPQVTTLLAATALSVLLWFIPYAELLTYPFRIFVTFIHEGGHALAALLTGNSVRSLTVSVDGSGEVYSMAGGLFSRMFVSSAGYLGAMTFGALLLVLIRRTVAARYVLAGSAALILLLTVLFGFLAPVWNLSLPGLFTLVAGVALPLGLLAAARYAAPKVAAFLVSFLAVQCVLNAVFDLKNVLFMSALTDAHTDAANMAAATGVPAIFWSLFWFALAFVIVSLALRAYAVSKETPTQPDLPFEDSPLEV
ncbi:MAG TPA: M50 family metallopeptidase [Pyrinomonadaceae bacterium]|nr:M50 family metallopeptidase [Pyrinomonadaceae bacterium]